jgi:hypothetical protein
MDLLAPTASSHHSSTRLSGAPLHPPPKLFGPPSNALTRTSPSPQTSSPLSVTVYTAHDAHWPPEASGIPDFEDQAGMLQPFEVAPEKRKTAGDESENEQSRPSMPSPTLVHLDRRGRFSSPTVRTSEEPAHTGDALGHRSMPATASPEAVARLDYLGQLLPQMLSYGPPQFGGETQSPYDFTMLRPSMADLQEFGHPEAVLRLLNYQFHGQHVVEYCGEIVFRPHGSTSWIQLMDTLKDTIFLAPGNQLLGEYIEELIAACQGQIHEASVEVTPGASQAKAEGTIGSYSEPEEPCSVVLLPRAVTPDRTKAPRPKPRKKTKENLDSAGSKGSTLEEENDLWNKAYSHKQRGKVCASRAESSSTGAAKNAFDNPSRRLTRSDVRPGYGFSPQLNVFYKGETSAQKSLTNGVFHGYAVHLQPH